MTVRKAVNGISGFLLETVGEAVAELVLSVLACALLTCLVLIVYLSWSLGPISAVAGVGLLSLLLAYGGWNTFRDPAKGRGRRGVAAVGTAGFSLAAALAVFLLFYGTGCDCL